MICRAKMIDGSPVTFEWTDHNVVPLAADRDCWLTTFSGEGFFVRSEYRGYQPCNGHSLARWHHDQAVLENAGVDTSTVEHLERWGGDRGDRWVKTFERPFGVERPVIYQNHSRFIHFTFATAAEEPTLDMIEAGRIEWRARCSEVGLRAASDAPGIVESLRRVWRAMEAAR